MTGSTSDSQLVVRLGEECCGTHVLQDEYVLIGSSDVCGITLPDSTLAPIHCAIRCRGSEYTLEDWESDQGVLVDNRRIQGETRVFPTSNIQVGRFSLELVADNMETPASIAGVEEDTAMRLPPKKEEVSSTVAARPAPLEEESLQSEIEQLQYELAERDALIAELTDRIEAGDDELNDDSDDALLQRLDELLTELEQHDERTAILEQLLQATEDKHRADQDERRQLGRWIEDIEARLGDREDEWRAECDSLSHRVETLLSERDDLMRELSQGSPTNSGETNTDRDLFLELKRELHQSQERNSQLEQQVRERDKQLATRSEADQALREEHLKLAQERAALARQQAELATLREPSEVATSRPETEIDCRLREFRQHLREIHDEEQQNPRNLSTRIKQIWNRMEAMG